MSGDLCKNAVVGTKQVIKAVQAGTISFVYLADDVEAFLKNKLKAVCYENGVEIRTVPTMQELGEACGIDVGAACAGVPKA